MKSLLNTNNEFVKRHIGPNETETAAMLKTIGVGSVEQLVDETIPPSIRLKQDMQLSEPMSEANYLSSIKSYANKNILTKSYIGLGYYPCFVPSVILRNVLENPGWYTQYTPYQAEIAQGRLEMLLNYQTMICDLTKMDIANASLLDEATAAAEAMTMADRMKDPSKDHANTILVSNTCLPQTIDVLITRAKPLNITVKVLEITEATLSDDVYAILLQYPDLTGALSDYQSLANAAHSKKISVICATDLLALTLLKAPGEFGADIAIGSAQRFGVPMGFGGPHAAFMACKDEFKRQMPGRIIGVSIDANGKQAYRMSLQTREQHIRRDKATSNICTAQALLANMAAMYAIYHGPQGLTEIAQRTHFLTNILANALEKLGLTLVNKTYFDTLTFKTNNLAEIRKTAEAAKINFSYFNTHLGIALNETTDLASVQEIVDVIASALNKTTIKVDADLGKLVIPANIARQSAILTHSVFNTYHSETEMMRYLKRLENKDLSLTQSMISLGSCTMKLNAATEMIPITWNEFAGLHPFAPHSQAEGFLNVFAELEHDLKVITGFAGVSLQPNAGAQGEYAGLLTIKKYLENLGQGHRHICLIPQSAHGTNPATAVMAGMQVIITKCDEKGNIDIADLKAKAIANKENLAALMVTYPSTHGVFEEGIKEICEIIHQNGGQVYMDGANMNAQVGLTSPGSIGADVCHLNLHKTFCIPHGGGGPGMGPICVASHLVPFLPGHALAEIVGSSNKSGAVSAAPYGSADILLISHAYIKMMGATGLKKATQIAILNANYIKSRLEAYYPILYVGFKGRVAHELIFDCRDFKKTAGVEVEDIAKRLIDYGFHAPTVSFPVAGTMMVEPTESENKAELDRFCDALISIRTEIQEIIDGKANREQNVLKHAPHPMSVIITDTWTRPYSREKAAFPIAYVRTNKFWPAIGRVNNAHGDRELICTCPDISTYM